MDCPQHTENRRHPLYVTSNDIFAAKPNEIRLLRRILGWTQKDLAATLGLKVRNPDTSQGGCFTIYQWEKGKAVPDDRSRTKMVQIVEMFRVEYLQELNRKRRFRLHEDWALRLRTSYEESRRVDSLKASDQGPDELARAVIEAKRVAAATRRSVRAAARKRRRRT